ncbi:MAG: xanthine dehydrogenase family protein molybdopterin-binding subunit [Thermoplasmata archaeon]|nr:xanthine dehydrogenase family protein molybdopterin-binding subunit [Thermoplasmata archaeon]
MIRSDLAAKLAGRTTFGADLDRPGMLWAALVLSPVAHGRIRRVDLSKVRKAPGVVVAITAPDVEKLLPKGSGDPERPVFPTREVLYRHQPIAAIAARTLSEARAAALLAEVDIDPLPIVDDIETVFPEWPEPSKKPNSAVVAHVHARHGDLEAAFREAEFVHSETYRTAGVHQVALETHACLAEVEGAIWRVTTSTQSPFSVREDLSSQLGLPESAVVVEGSWVGGGFGGKTSALLEPFALLLAAAAGAPVRLALSYREEFLLGRTTLPCVVRIESSVAKGRVTGRRVRMLLDCGSTMPSRDFATGYAITFLLGPYNVDTFEVEGYGLRTNKPPFGPHRAPLIPQLTFVIDSHMDSIARRLSVDPIAFRRAHVWHEGDSTALGQRIGPSGIDSALERAEKTVLRWRGNAPREHGFGIGVGYWSTGVSAGGEARLRLTPQELVIEQGEREIGSGSVVRGLVAVAERSLGLPASAIRVAYSDTASAPFDSGVFGSRTVGALGQAVQKASEELVRELEARTGTKGSLRLEFDGRSIRAVASGLRRPIAELLTPEELNEGGLKAHGKFYGPPMKFDESRVVAGSFYPVADVVGAVHLAEVSVDRETGAVKVHRYAAFHDVGVALDMAMVRAQVEGGVVMGLGTALTEESLWSSEGSLRNPGLLDYRLPRLNDVPPIEVYPVEGFPGAGPFGAKGVGEPPIIPVPAAVANAVADATGARVFELPLSPERVARALKLL